MSDLVGNLATIALMAYIASSFVGGSRLIRLTAWMALWQFCTPVRPFVVDFPLMLAGWAAVEVAYLQVRKAV